MIISPTMSEPTESSTPVAWQPLTFRGVAAFAAARNGRLWLVQLGVAVLVAASVLFFLSRAWWPTITSAIHTLPDQGFIRGSQLAWAGDDPVILAESPWLAFVVDTENTREPGQIADVQVELGADEMRCRALLGVFALPYPDDWEIAVNRPELEPWWGAWQPMLLAGVALLVVAGLLVQWFVLACLYAPVVWLVAFFADRAAGWGVCWRLAGAALMPGALLMGCAIVLYGAGQLTLIHVGFTLALHLVVGWAYLIGAPLCLPREQAAVPAPTNPFGTPAVEPPPTEVVGPPGADAPRMPPSPEGNVPASGGPGADSDPAPLSVTPPARHDKSAAHDT